MYCTYLFLFQTNSFKMLMCNGFCRHIVEYGTCAKPQSQSILEVYQKKTGKVTELMSPVGCTLRCGAGGTELTIPEVSSAIWMASYSSSEPGNRSNSNEHVKCTSPITQQNVSSVQSGRVTPIMMAPDPTLSHKRDKEKYAGYLRITKRRHKDSKPQCSRVYAFRSAHGLKFFNNTRESLKDYLNTSLFQTYRAYSQEMI